MARRALSLVAALLAVGLAAAVAPAPAISGPAPPKSPFGATCNPNGGIYYSGVYPSSPYPVYPFVDEYARPPDAQMESKACRSDGHCARSFFMTVKDVRLPAFKNSMPDCKSQPDTLFVTYNGSVPGPTITVPAGHEAVVRFRNDINDTLFAAHAPCTTEPGRSGHGFSVHHHGSASLAPYDGWADDVTCYGEVKEYVYPTNRPATEWYHDHAIHITSDNAYSGMAGMFVVSSKVKDGGCGEPWNLENIPDLPMQIGDRVIDSQCQLFYDNKKGGVHETSAFGDITLVNGKAYPRVPVDLTANTWRRFRFNNQAISRPYWIKIKDQNLNDIHAQRCYIIAGDGGYKDKWVKMPPGGLMLAVAERYEVVCNFSGLSGQVAYLWNDRLSGLMKEVPYFCWSHLIARLDITGTPGPAAAANSFDTANANNANGNFLNVNRPNLKVLNSSHVAQALAMVNRNQFHRNFQFGKSGGQWVINGETWDTNKIAAKDIGHNTWEVWRLETGGGWFHPIHMHLVDFYVIKRVTSNPVPNTIVTSTWPGVRDQEFMTPKDVVYLGPSETIYLLVRFGAFKGDYMFHCHNLVHEDNDMLRAFSINADAGKSSMVNQRSTGLFVPNYVAGVIYGNYYAVSSQNPMDTDTLARKVGQWPKLDWDYLYYNVLNQSQWYRVMYPTQEDKKAYWPLENPWETKWC